MAQNYTEQLRKDNVRDAIYEDLQNNCEVLRTSWSGNAFPANPKVGQPCYRVDEDKLYYWDGYKWSQKGGGGSAELKTMELAAATSERVSITLEGARCLDKNMMFVFVDKIAQDPSTYSMNDNGTVVNFNPAIPANAAVTLRWFDTDVGTFDTAIFASDAEFAAGELTNRAPNVKQVHSLSDYVKNNYVDKTSTQTISGSKSFTQVTYTKTPIATAVGKEAVTADWFKLPTCSVRTVIDTYVNGTSWYRIWSDGWKEQGGVVLTGNSATPVTVTLLTPFSDANYTLQATCNPLTVQWVQMVDLQIVNKTATSFGIIANPSNNNNNWFACGY